MPGNWNGDYMTKWYASVNYGLEAIAGEIIKAHGAKNIKLLDSAVIFSCVHEINIKCINNLFIILSEMHSKSIAEAAKKVSRHSYSFPILNGKSFRVIVMESGKLCAISPNVMKDIEKNISYHTQLTPNRAKPDIEIWLNRRNDGQTFFMVRVKKHRSFDKTLKRGELRPDIVDIMLHKAKISKQSVVVDMFGGWGAIAAAVAKSGRYQKIYTGDINDECVKYQQERLKNVQNCIVQKWDAHNLPLEDTSIDAIITDPPWGEFEKINIRQFYDNFIREAFRVLRPGGSLVFLSSAYEEACSALDKYGFVSSAIPLKINGKDTHLFCAIIQER